MASQGKPNLVPNLADHVGSVPHVEIKCQVEKSQHVKHTGQMDSFESQGACNSSVGVSETVTIVPPSSWKRRARGKASQQPNVGP